MKLKDLIKHLQSKPEQDADVNFCVWKKGDCGLVSIEMAGPESNEVIYTLAKHARREQGATR